MRSKRCTGRQWAASGQLRLAPRSSGPSRLAGQLLLLDAETDAQLDAIEVPNVDWNPAIAVSPDQTAVCVTYGLAAGEYAANVAKVAEIDGLTWRVLLDVLQEPAFYANAQPAPAVSWGSGAHPKVELRWRQGGAAHRYPDVVNAARRTPAPDALIVSHSLEVLD